MENREIKFRAWLKNAREIVEVLEIDFYSREVAYIWTEQVSQYELEQTREVENFDGVIIMQFTGFRDKNDIEIYEGDFIRSIYNGNHSPVKYTNGAFTPICFFESTEFEVIGNVYENPELLKEENV